MLLRVTQEDSTGRVMGEMGEEAGKGIQGGATNTSGHLRDLTGTY